MNRQCLQSLLSERIFQTMCDIFTLCAYFHWTGFWDLMLFVIFVTPVLDLFHKRTFLHDVCYHSSNFMWRLILRYNRQCCSLHHLLWLWHCDTAGFFVVVCLVSVTSCVSSSIFKLLTNSINMGEFTLCKVKLVFYLADVCDRHLCQVTGGQA